MTIQRNLILTIRGEESNLSAPLSVYYGDRNIDLFFEIQDFDYTFSGSLMQNLDNAQVSIIIKKPNSQVYRTTKAQVEQKKVKFTITQEVTDELSEIGIYTLQLQFYDTVNGGRVSIPPFTFEVKELIAPIDDDVINQAQAEYSIVDETRVSTKANGVEVTARWSPGDYITADRLNSMQDRITELEKDKSVLKYGSHNNLPTNPREYTQYFDTTIRKKLTYYNGKWHDDDGFIVERVVEPNK